MMLLLYTFHVAAVIMGIKSQEITIPVGESGLDTLTTIRNVDAEGNYDVGYNENQLTGGASFYREKGYTNGTRTGSYGYTTRNGLIRIVTYIADQDGYRAELLTNEPGVGTANPSNVTVSKETEPDPAALAQGPTSSRVPQQSLTAPLGEGSVGSGVSSRSSESSVTYATGNDVIRNYVTAPVLKSEPTYRGIGESSAQVRIFSPFGQYQYVV